MAATSSTRPHRVWRVLGIIIGSIVGLILIIAIILAVDANIFRKPIAHMASVALHRDVDIGGLKINLFAASPRITVDNIRVGNPAGFTNQMANVAQIDVTFEWLPLLTGNIVLPTLAIEQPNIVLARTADNRANWVFGDEGKSETNGGGKLPVIQHLALDSGNLTYDDAIQKMHFTGTFQTADGATGTVPFQLSGDGTLNKKDFKLNFSGPSLFDLKPETPYQFNTDIHLGGTDIHATGTIPKPFDMTNFQSQLDLKGNDLADLYYITGLAFPNTPPYHLNGELDGSNHGFHFSNFGGNLGSSDLFGDIKIQTTQKRPKIIADLKSKLLDFKDLGALFGAQVPGARTGAVGTATQPAADARLLPNAHLQLDRVRAMDAEVHYRAGAVNAPGLPLKQVSLDFYLDNSVLKFNPFSFTLPQGKLEGTAQIDAQTDEPAVDLDVRLSNAHLEDFMPKNNKTVGPPPIEGPILARAKIHGTGDSVHKAASTANGEITIVVPHGKIRQAFAELLGIDVVEGAGLLLSGDQQQTDLRCGVADFKVASGIMTPRVMVFDTGVVLSKGSGSINLNSEALDIDLKGEPKETRLLRVMAPITVNGTLLHPSIGVDPKKAAAQAGVAAALGAFLTPLVAILPFVDVDLAKDANCSALINQAAVKAK